MAFFYFTMYNIHIQYLYCKVLQIPIGSMHHPSTNVTEKIQMLSIKCKCLLQDPCNDYMYYDAPKQAIATRF